MRPPICVICGKRFYPPEGGEIVYFKETESVKEWRKRVKKEGIVAHPPNAEWFCKEHLSLALKYKHLPIKEALKAIERQLKDES